MKDARFTTLNDTKIGDVIYFTEVPYFKEDMRLYKVAATVKSITPTKSGKRFHVVLVDANGVVNYKIRAIGLNTPLEQLSEDLLKNLVKQRGWKQ